MKTLRVADVARAAGISQPTWSQVETAVAVPTREQLTGAMKALEVPEATADDLLELRERAKVVEWWHQYTDVAAAFLLKLIGYESSAVEIRQCTSGWLPGLLQTDAWARSAMLVPGAKTRPENVDRAVDLRMRRQVVLDNAGFKLHAICGEEALRYQPGGKDVQIAQLRRLLSVVTTNSRITLQVTPFSGPLHLGHSTPYTIIDFAHPLDTTIVHHENAMSSFSDAPPEVRRWGYVFDNLKSAALSKDETVRLIESIIKELEA
jgi:transcriptional regulator with XRE-family HTH domain